MIHYAKILASAVGYSETVTEDLQMRQHTVIKASINHPSGMLLMAETIALTDIFDTLPSAGLYKPA